LNRFVKEKNIRAGSVFVFGAMSTGDITAGWRSADRSDSDRRHFDDRREFSGVGNITLLEKPPPALGNVTWSEPQPYVHIHITLSGGVGRTGEVLIGHLRGGGLAQAFAEIYEFV
jgi:predicted DNA-binding protein with PD1-like motif